MSDLFGNHIVGFSTRRLKCLRIMIIKKVDVPLYEHVLFKGIFIL